MVRPFSTFLQRFPFASSFLICLPLCHSFTILLSVFQAHPAGDEHVSSFVDDLAGASEKSVMPSSNRASVKPTRISAQ